MSRGRRQARRTDIPRDQRRYYDAAITAGWTITMSRGSSHTQWLSPDGATIIHASASPSDHRTTKNVRAQLRQAGVDV